MRPTRKLSVLGLGGAVLVASVTVLGIEVGAVIAQTTTTTTAPPPTTSSTTTATSTSTSTTSTTVPPAHAAPIAPATLPVTG
jgi:hypothetical protein